MPPKERSKARKRTSSVGEESVPEQGTSDAKVSSQPNPDQVSLGPRRHPRPFTKPIQLTELAIATERAAKRLQFFVAGPYIDTNWTENELEGKAPAAILRLKIFQFVRSRHHDPVIGEHRGVEEIGAAQFRTQASALVTEMALVRNAHAIILIPSSPGSFSELGSWVLKKELCQKMLLLADDSHREGPPSYLKDGVFETATNFGARLHWISYSGISQAIDLVEEFLFKIEDDVLTMDVLNG